MKVAPLLSSKPSPTLTPTPIPSKYAWSVFYPMQAVPEKVENQDENNKNDKKENVGNDKNVKMW